MKNHTGQLALPVDADPSLLEKLLAESSQVFLKKLSNNDRDWAVMKNKHQAGVYIPATERDGGFFPPLVVREDTGGESGSAAIREAMLHTEWPQHSETSEARLTNYTSKGQETHLTRLPKAAFAELAPASYLVMGKIAAGNGSNIYRCLTIDSYSDEVDFLLEWLAADPLAISRVYDPQAVRAQREGFVANFLARTIAALRTGNFAGFFRQHADFPDTKELAALACTEFLSTHKLANLSPWEIEKPGDALRTVSRVVEWEKFQEFQLKARSLNLIHLLAGDDLSDMTLERFVTVIVTRFQEIDSLFMSASQQRKSRAGYSFEHHIERMLRDGGITHEKQVVLKWKKRPDFIMPSYAALRDTQRQKEDVLVLSAKTTLRERWKQVPIEVANCSLFLGTVDENIASNAIEHMQSLGIVLVVPESLKDANTTEYKAHDNVISFRTFFDEEVKSKQRLLC